MNKLDLLKEIFEYYGYSYEICDDGKVNEFTEEGELTVYSSVDKALKNFVATMEITNNDCFMESNGTIEVYNTWSKEQIDFIKSLHVNDDTKIRPKCYLPNNDTYPLCKGNKYKEQCNNCSLYENVIEPYDYI